MGKSKKSSNIDREKLRVYNESQARIMEYAAKHDFHQLFPELMHRAYSTNSEDPYGCMIELLLEKKGCSFQEYANNAMKKEIQQRDETIKDLKERIEYLEKSESSRQQAPIDLHITKSLNLSEKPSIDNHVSFATFSSMDSQPILDNPKTVNLPVDSTFQLNDNTTIEISADLEMESGIFSNGNNSAANEVLKSNDGKMECAISSNENVEQEKLEIDTIDGNSTAVETENNVEVKMECEFITSENVEPKVPKIVSTENVEPEVPEIVSNDNSTVVKEDLELNETDSFSSSSSKTISSMDSATSSDSSTESDSSKVTDEVMSGNDELNKNSTLENVLDNLSEEKLKEVDQVEYQAIGKVEENSVEVEIKDETNTCEPKKIIEKLLDDFEPDYEPED